MTDKDLLMNMNVFLTAVTIVLTIAAAVYLLGMALETWARHRARNLGRKHGANGEEGLGFKSNPNFLSYTIGYYEGLTARAQAAAGLKADGEGAVAIRTHEAHDH